MSGAARMVGRWSPLRPAARVAACGPATRGEVTAFRCGEAAGAIRGVMAGSGLHVLTVTSGAWRRGNGLEPLASPADCLARAKALFPKQAKLFARPKDYRRAIAALICAHGRNPDRRGVILGVAR